MINWLMITLIGPGEPKVLPARHEAGVPTPKEPTSDCQRAAISSAGIYSSSARECSANRTNMTGRSTARSGDGHVEAATDLGYQLLARGVPVEFYVDPAGGHD